MLLMEILRYSVTEATEMERSKTSASFHAEKLAKTRKRAIDDILMTGLWISQLILVIQYDAKRRSVNERDRSLFILGLPIQFLQTVYIYLIEKWKGSILFTD